MTEQEIIEYCKTNKVAIHCPTQEDYNRFTEMLERNGKNWCSGNEFSENNYWKNYKSKTCLNYSTCNAWTYNSKAYKNYLIKTVSELMDTGTDTWKIQDLTSKQITKCENFTAEVLTHLKGLTARQQDAFIKKIRGDMK